MLQPHILTTQEEVGKFAGLEEDRKKYCVLVEQSR